MEMKKGTLTKVRSQITSCYTKGLILINIANEFTLICQILYDVTAQLGFYFEKDAEGLLVLIKIEYFT